MAKPKRVDPIKQREKRAKIAAAVGVVLLLAVAGYEIPSVMKGPPPAPPRHVDSETTASATPATPSSAPSTGLTGSGQLADTDVPPAGSTGQLVSFSVFESKNPFAPQVSRAAASPSSSSSPSGGRGADVPPASPTRTTTIPTTTTPPSTVSVVPSAPTGSPATAPAPAPQAAAPPAVTITVNGVATRVAAQGTFPRSGPVFRLVSFDSATAQIGIVGGSYAAGDATLTLHLKDPVTLENQTDGKRYRLELVATH